MRGKVRRWGNSLAVRIPQAFAEEVGLTDDSTIEMRLLEGGLLIEPAVEYGAPTLDELVAGITEENRHGEVEWGPPVGKEVW